jgi:hypothetical protein
VLGPDHHRPVADRLAVEVDELLQGAGGEHAERAGARHQPRRAGPFAASGGQQHRPGGHRRQPARPGQLQRRRPRPAGRGVGSSGPAGHGGGGAELDAGGRGAGGPGGGVARPADAAVQVAQAEPGVVGVPGHAAGVGLPVDRQHPPDPEPAQLDRGGQPGRPGADHQHVDVDAVHGMAPRDRGGPLGTLGGAPSTSAMLRPLASANSDATAPVHWAS